MKSESMGTLERHIFILPGDWTWWTWTVTTTLLLVGLCGHPDAFLAAMGLTFLQTIVIYFREKKVSAFPVQLRLAYLALLALCHLPFMRWLYWLPTVGTFALVIFGYCLMARVLSLLPWNRREPLSGNLFRRTFLYRPDLSRLAGNPQATGCAGGLCSIEAQVARRTHAPG
jgi:hypothetical protein